MNGYIGISLLITTELFITVEVFASPLEEFAQKVAQKPKAIAITDVNVITMAHEEVLQGQTVVVRDGLIELVGDKDHGTIPQDATIIDGHEKYLMPGLADMHVHLMQENDLLPYLANGVTTVQNMWGFQGFWKWKGVDHLLLREKVARGKVLGPRVITAGPVTDGISAVWPGSRNIADPEEARAAVFSDKAAGYDFFKVYSRLSPDVFKMIVKTAKETGMDVKGHVPDSTLPLENALRSGMFSIEHLTGYIDVLGVKYVFPPEKLSEYARLTRESHVWNCPTITTMVTFFCMEKDFIRSFEHRGMGHRTWFEQVFLRIAGQAFRKVKLEKNDCTYHKRMTNLMYQAVKALHDEGAGLLLGTDSPFPGTSAGFSIHDELTHLVAAGLTPYEALKTGTINAAESLRETDRWGTLSVGKTADLVLLSDNPLRDIQNTRKIEGVVLRGKWITKGELDTWMQVIGAGEGARGLSLDWIMTLLFFVFAMPILFLMKVFDMLIHVRRGFFSKWNWVWFWLLPIYSVATKHRAKKYEKVEQFWRLGKELTLFTVITIVGYAAFYVLAKQVSISAISLSYLAIVPLMCLTKAGDSLFQILTLATTRYHLPAIHDAPWCSKSLSDFWGRRWNTWMSDWFREVVNILPKWSRGLGVLGIFVFSGFIHEIMINLPLWLMTGAKVMGTMLMFFGIQGVATVIDRKYIAPLGFQRLRRCFLWLSILIPLPLFLNEAALRILHLWPL